MAPLTPHWPQPSHPDIQRVIHPTDPSTYLTKSLSKVTLPPFALFAKLSSPPCTPSHTPTYATVQTSPTTHLNLNSDLVYINHSCTPSLIFDIPSRSVLAGPKGLTEGEELTFFYPSTEWSMEQPFECFCGAGEGLCRGWIRGAGQMAAEQLEGVWLNPWIREGIERRDGVSVGAGAVGGGGKGKEGLENGNGHVDGDGEGEGEGVEELNGKVMMMASGMGKNKVRGEPTSRELSGEMGGDTL